MPYIPKGPERDDIDAALGEFITQAAPLPWTEARLCYALSRISGWYVLRKGLSWGTLEGVKQALLSVVNELQTIEDQYESLKRLENGDVPELAKLRATLDMIGRAAQ